MRTVLSTLTVALATASLVGATDWTTWRADSSRSGYTADVVPEQPVLRWTWYPRHAPSSAWPRDDRLEFDRVNHVVVAGGLVCFGNSATTT